MSRGQQAARLAVEVGSVKDTLERLHNEVQMLGDFHGSFFAENGLRQAGTYVNDCLQRLIDLAAVTP